VEGGVPGVQIFDGVGAPLGGGVAVGDDFVAQRRVADFFAPALHVAQEKQLVGVEAGDFDRRCVGGGEAVGVVRGVQARDIGDIFAQGLRAVESEVGERFIGIELGREPCAG